MKLFLVTASLLLLLYADAVKTTPSSKNKKMKNPRDRFDSLAEYVGHMCSVMCRATAKKMNGFSTYRGRVELLSYCEEYSERVQHMVQISGDDALIQLQKDEERAARRNSGATNYYRKSLETGSEGKHKELLKKICRKNAEWVLKKASRMTKEQISEEMQPQIGQWLLNVAAGSDPTMTNADLRDDPPEEATPEEDDFDDDDDYDL